jgi:hypothetical protein
MPYMDFFERRGMVKGPRSSLEVCLDVKFGEKGLELMPELRQIRDHELLRKVLANIKAADSPGGLRRVWTRKRRPRKTDPMRDVYRLQGTATPAPRRSGRRRS